ncbi:MAG TPA: type II secretion system-associated lipoprotein [Leptospiraceae bacterium]|nr:type II secretion system-associated lipoprotein [Leptospiraceae bacterium]HMW08464.1 type II secretion system-associated lipoprotein [Leptospiraceae bacterium]HMX33898.1 type II secretion system-associated lipoprotein [Leptospiraceae bacterium]HMY34211.1 type II secretion system-associated lipoprotein [Leptospiraceae bacterium]HMZ66429.1 type II secretion system-associated lipoprotein [Leptospiraceae bacterium]
MFRSIFIFLSIFFILACNKRLIKKDDLTLINEHYSQNTYYVKENLVLDNKDIIKKDTSVKIWIESTASILKVKCYNSNEDRESAVGRMVTYIINEDFKNKKFTVEYLDQLIAEKLVYYDAKDVSKDKKAKK